MALLSLVSGFGSYARPARVWMSRVLLLSGVLYSTLGLSGRAVASVNFVLSAPGGAGGLNQSSPVAGNPGSLTEDFNSFAGGTLPPTGTLAVGTYTSNASSLTGLSNADLYGGAGGTGRYPLFGAAPTTQFLSVNLTPSKYLGFWWSAGNDGNLVKIYDGATLLGTFDSATLTALLGTYGSPVPVLAADGNTYSSDLYFGNPNFGSPGSRPNTNDPYAYVNLTLSDPSLAFTRIEFSGGNFEFDNVTVSPNYYAPNSVPGPLPIVGCGAAFAWSRRLRRRIQQRRP